MLTSVQRDKLDDMLWDYFHLKLPYSFINQLIEDNPEIRKELDSGSITDTMVRDETIDSVLSALNMRSWPTYGEIAVDKTLASKFDAELQEKVSAIGGEYFA